MEKAWMKKQGVGYSNPFSRPNFKAEVLAFISYSVEGRAQEILDAGAQGFVQKPFSLATLSVKMHEVMQG
jgi:CheY-like chemotaxis protein